MAKFSKAEKIIRKNVYLALFLIIGVVLALLLIFIYLFQAINQTPTEPVKKPSDSHVIVVPIIVYHYIEDVKNPFSIMRKTYDTVPYVFEEQIQTLLNSGFDFVTVSDIEKAISGNGSLPKKSVAITFDDGYGDFYTTAFPLLKKYFLKATVFIAPGFIDKPGFMTYSELRDINRSGLVEIGAHSMRHLYLPRTVDPIAKWEIDQSKIVLEQKLGVKIISFSYPYGAYDNRIIGYVKEAGFLDAVTTDRSIIINSQNKYAIPRIYADQKVGKELLKLVEIPR